MEEKSNLFIVKRERERKVTEKVSIFEWVDWPPILLSHTFPHFDPLSFSIKHSFLLSQTHLSISFSHSLIPSKKLPSFSSLFSKTSKIQVFPLFWSLKLLLLGFFFVSGSLKLWSWWVKRVYKSLLALGEVSDSSSKVASFCPPFALFSLLPLIWVVSQAFLPDSGGLSWRERFCDLGLV